MRQKTPVSVFQTVLQEKCPARRPAVHANSMLFPALALTIVIVWGAVTPLAGQTRAERRARGPSLRAADLVTLTERCGAAEPTDDSFPLLRQHAAPRMRSGEGTLQAFEENPLFIYALASPPARQRDGEEASGTQTPPRWLRRVFLLKPSIVVVEDSLRTRSSGQAIAWRLRSSGEPEIEKRQFRAVEGDTAIVGEALLPESASIRKGPTPARGDQPAGHQVEVLQESSGKARFLHVFHLQATSEKGSIIPSKVVKGEDGQLELTVTADGKVFGLKLPAEMSQAGELEISEKGGKVLLPRRLLPSGILPHGREGSRLLERWDAPYRRDRAPGWDVGRPSSNLVQSVKDGNLRPGRAIVLGCGTGTNAIYLASKGFEVTGVDIAPTALNLAEEKARKADVKVQWILADVVALPQLEPFDVIFDRGCYHHVHQYNAAGYVETARRLSHKGTLILLLAGSANRTGGGGPPKVRKEEIEGDFSKLYEFEWLRETHFDRPDSNAEGALAWSALMRRKDN